MHKHHYDWNNVDAPPAIGIHSLAKHKVLERYVFRYLKILTSPYNIENFRISIVDAFSGGGRFRLENSEEIVRGSPLIFLESVEAAKIEINSNRHKKINFSTDFYFCDNSKQALQFLRQVLDENGYASRIGRDIFLLEGSFDQLRAKISKQIIDRGRKVNRSIWLLDQYSYKDVPLTHIRALFRELPYAELLLTFGIGNLVDRISESKSFATSLRKLELDKHQRDYVVALKTSEKHWKQLAQKVLYKHLIEKTRSRYFTPFFITSRKSNKSYWFLHLSQHPRARDEMAKLHWEEHNYFSHFGGAGLNMLGFDPAKGVDPDQPELEFGFDDDARSRSIEGLLSDLPEILFKEEDGITFENLFAEIANETPATALMIQEALVKLRNYGELDILNASGRSKERANVIGPKDLIRPTRSPILPGIPRQTAKR